MNFAKSILPPLEPKLLVMWERIGEALPPAYFGNCNRNYCIMEMDKSVSMAAAILFQIMYEDDLYPPMDSLHEDFTHVEVIGAGKFGQVYRVRCNKTGN